MFWRKEPQKKLRGQFDEKAVEEIIRLAHLLDGVWNYVWLIGDLTNISAFEAFEANIGYLRQQSLSLSPELLNQARDWLSQTQVREAITKISEWMVAAETLNLEIYEWAKQICQKSGQEYGDKLEDGLGQIPNKQTVKDYRVRFRQADARGKQAILSELLKTGAGLEKKALPLLKKYGWMK